MYPPRCPLCERIVKFSGTACPSCRGRLRVVVEPTCEVCGRPLQPGTGPYCEDCLQIEHSFDRGVSAYRYEGEIVRALYRLKYQNKREYAMFFAREALRLCGGRLESWNVQAVMPVPIHKSRRRTRGYNQAEWIARPVAEALALRIDVRSAVRVRATKALKECGRRQRRLLLEGAFLLREDMPDYETVLLVDDIYTTGATADALARQLKRRGVSNVYLLTAAIGSGGENSSCERMAELL